MASGIMNTLAYAWLLGLAQSAAVRASWSSAPLESALEPPEGTFIGVRTATILNASVAEGQPTAPSRLVTRPIILPTLRIETKGEKDTTITPSGPAFASITVAAPPGTKAGNGTATISTKKPPRPTKQTVQPLLRRAETEPPPAETTASGKDNNGDDKEVAKSTSTKGLSSATTTISTKKPSTSIPHLPDILCSRDTCSSDKCSTSQKRFLDNSTLDLFRRGEPEKGDWRDPSDYLDSREKFMAGELHDAAFSLRPASKIVKPSDTDDDTTTSNYIIFEDIVSSISVSGLTGCTSIMVISKRGAWVSHIWEAAFKYDQIFQEEAIGQVHKGDGSVSRPFGIDELRNQANVGPRGILFGDNTNPNDDPDIHVVLVTPRPRGEEFRQEEDGSITWFEDSVRESEDLNADKPPLYENRLDQIRTNLRETFGPNVPIQIIDYSPELRTLAETKAWMDAVRIYDFVQLNKVKDEVLYRMRDPDFKSFRGKALLQYRPASDCADKARWRLWVEKREVQARAEWTPLSGQLFKPEKLSEDDDDDDTDDTDEVDYGSEGHGDGVVERAIGTTKAGNGDGDDGGRTPLEVGSQHCNDEDDFPDHEPVNHGDVWSGAEDACQHGVTVMGPGKSWESNGDASGSAAKVHFRVSYIDGCVTDLGIQNMRDPLNRGPKGDQCHYLFYDNWRKCNNGGVGGYRDAGCLRYYTGASPLKE